jgi:hypothetical protein
MKVIDNTASLQYPTLGDDSTFLPVVTWAFTNSTKVVVFTEAGAVPSGDTFKRVNIEVFDQLGNKKTGSISSATGTVSIDLDAATTLDLTGRVQFRATVSTVKNLAKDGSFYNFNPVADATGSLSFEK